MREYASTLRDGIGCTIPLETAEDPANDMVGGMNYHFTIVFEDNVTWICRTRRQNISSPPIELQNAIIESEVSTMQFLFNVGLPVPRVHGYSPHSDTNAVGRPFILMDMIKGKPLNWYAADDAAKKHVLRQLADIFITLSQHPFETIGCLYHSGSSFTIGPMTFDDHATQDTDGTLIPLGPFPDCESYLSALIERNLQFILEGKAYSNARIDAYLVHLALRDYLPAISAFYAPSGGKFFLKHMDDKGDHIIVDDAFNIVGIIDWEWAQFVPKSDAFAAPLFLLDVAKYYDGHNQLSAEEILFANIFEDKGHSDLADAVRGGRVHHRIAHCIGGDVDNLDDFSKLFLGLRKFVAHEHPAEDSWVKWKDNALVEYRLDNGLQKLLLDVA